jgi:hypothetical protein
MLPVAGVLPGFFKSSRIEPEQMIAHGRRRPTGELGVLELARLFRLQQRKIGIHFD